MPEKVVMIKLSSDDLERASANLLQLADLIGPMLKEKNFDGQGIQDEKDARKDLQTGAYACATLLAMIETDVKSNGLN